MFIYYYICSIYMYLYVLFYCNYFLNVEIHLGLQELVLVVLYKVDYVL